MNAGTITGIGLLIGGLAAVNAATAPRVPVLAGKNRALAHQLGVEAETTFGWPGLASFLDIAAGQESGWNPQIRNKREANTNPNHARGFWQLRPKSAFPSSDANATREFPEGYWREHADLLLEPRVNLAAIVSYLSRNRGFKGGSSANMERLRASMAFPYFIGGQPQERHAAGYRRSIDKFRRATQRFGYPVSFTQQPAAIPRRIGVREAAEALGVILP